MGNSEKVEITEGTIFNIDLTYDGEIIFKVRRENGSFTPLSKEEIEKAVVRKGDEIRGRFLFGRVFSAFGIKVNPFQVWVGTGDSKHCYQFSDTFEYIGRCD